MDISENLDVVKDSGADVAIKVGSMVEVDLASGPAFATVRWIGSLPNMPCRMAGLELVLVNTDLYWLPCKIGYLLGNPPVSFHCLCFV